MYSVVRCPIRVPKENLLDESVHRAILRPIQPKEGFGIQPPGCFWGTPIHGHASRCVGVGQLLRQVVALARVLEADHEAIAPQEREISIAERGFIAWREEPCRVHPPTAAVDSAAL